MTRRTAILALWAAISGGMARRAFGAPASVDAPPALLTVNLSAWRQIDIVWNGQRVSLTPADVFAALKGRP